MKKDRVKEQFLEELRETPNVSIVCKKLSTSRNSIYRWRHEDKAFCIQMDLALSEGEDHFNDVSESKLMEKVKEGNLKAITFRLEKCSTKYSAHKIDDVALLEIRKKIRQKDLALWDEIKNEVKMEKFNNVMKEPAIVQPHTLKKMLSMGLIDWVDYQDSLKYSEEMEKKGITSQNQAGMATKKIEPTAEEILERYERRKKEIKNDIFPDNIIKN